MPADPAAAEPGYVLDAALLCEIARGDADIIALVQALDAAQVPMTVPLLAVTAAAVDVDGHPEMMAVVRGVCRLDTAWLGGILAFDDAAELAAAKSAVGDALDTWWDVQALELALIQRRPILTTSATLWRDAVRTVGGRTLIVVEVAELDE
ncbi:hypothetical protein [Bailinhaonella thermotolerans]|uniref:PIN domain-containing protein n=1 Tax=Bailinhaonella thermotolerans TaxID=1070861 RepID=A0A3A4AA43_9ACTN|nr:hypothetical protein [Bailinhaonella thermotolerans]RJL23224.1 hypothetical protein D5H75_33165 [Bailinhaonella thermotolerans]